ncbi:hypothetical protein D3C80_1055540 [compost metagenome]
MSLKEKIVDELVVICLALTMVGCGVVAVISLFSAIAFLPTAPVNTAIALIVCIVTARIATITYRPTVKRWKR